MLRWGAGGKPEGETIGERLGESEEECGAGGDKPMITDAEDAKEQMARLPNSLTELGDEDFPLFVTFKKFLAMLDGSLPQPFRAGEEGATEGGGGGDDDDDDTAFTQPDKEEGGGSESSRRAQRSQGPAEVNFDTFEHMYWPEFSDESRKALSPSQAWVDISSVIKGRVEAAASPHGCLSRDEYMQLSKNRYHQLPDTHTRTHTHIYTHTYIHTHTQTHTHTYIHTHTHTRADTQTQRQLEERWKRQ